MQCTRKPQVYSNLFLYQTGQFDIYRVLGPALIRILPQFQIHEGSQYESMGQQTGRKPWSPIGTGKVSTGRMFQDKNVTKSIL